MVSVDGTVQSYKTYKTTVGELLTEKNIELEPEDEVYPGIDVKLEDDMVITIKKAVPIVLTDGGVTKELKTTEETVGDFLKAKGIVLGDKDKVFPNPDDRLVPYVNVKITRIEEKTLVEQKKLPYDVTKRENRNMDQGTTKVVQEGEEGLAEVTYNVTYEDGKEKTREVLAERIIKQPLSKIVEVGTLGVLKTSRGDTIRYTKQLTMIATAYDATYESTGKRPGDRDYGITYTGVPVREGIVAVDPKVIPLGTKLYVEGYGYALAADIGGAIKGNRIDLYYDDPKKVDRFGVKKLKVYVLAD
ncbi:MAG: ubiquitin-like domain-containing protein [Thermoanaerobacteraceae bacterium]|nr:ubiquitin-like domain-containing protein [Thermoanaerobacteraceae bacterium]